ncbi:MAG: HD domain-containing phosphohydrolase [Thermodesulfobacteriota bacterium]
MRNSSKQSAQLRLAKLLKGKAVADLLHHGRAMLGDGAELAIVADGKTIVSTTGRDHFPGSYDLAFSLGGDAVMPGELLLESGPGLQRESARHLGALLALSLQQLIDSEATRRAVVADSLEQYRELALLRHATELFNQSFRLDTISRDLLEQCRSITPQATQGLVLSRRNDNGWTAHAAFGGEPASHLADIVQSALFADILSRGKEEIVNDLRADSRWRNEVDGLVSLLCIPLLSPGHWTGALILATQQRHPPFSSMDLKLVSTVAAVAASAMANAHHFEEVQNMQEALLRALATAIDSRDPCTAGHSQRVAHYAIALAKTVAADPVLFPDHAFSADQLQEMHYAAMLHDVGKIGVREAVLTKATRLSPEQLACIGLRLEFRAALQSIPWQEEFRRLEEINRSNFLTPEDEALVERLAGEKIRIGDHPPHALITAEEREKLLIRRGNLTPGEWEEIRNHPRESCRILRHIPFPSTLEQVMTIVRQHHEKLDGSGYPHGEKEESLLIQSRILAIVDIYDALTAKDRPYKRALPRDKALEILGDEARQGKIDARLLSVFRQHIEQIEHEVNSLSQENNQ